MEWPWASAAHCEKGEDHQPLSFNHMRMEPQAHCGIKGREHSPFVLREFFQPSPPPLFFSAMLCSTQDLSSLARD